MFASCVLIQVHLTPRYCMCTQSNSMQRHVQCSRTHHQLTSTLTLTSSGTRSTITWNTCLGERGQRRRPLRNLGTQIQTQSSPRRGHDLCRSTAPGSRSSRKANQKQALRSLPVVSRGGLRNEHLVVERGWVWVEGDAIGLRSGHCA